MTQSQITSSSIRADTGEVAGTLSAHKLYQAIVANHARERASGTASPSAPARPVADDTLGLPPSLEDSCGDLSKTYWGIIVPAGLDDPHKQAQLEAHLEALKPLFDRRRVQMGLEAYEFQQYLFEYEPGMTVESFLRLNTYDEVSPGNMEPEIMPYYLLIVASPVDIPWEFQQRLDGEYAVGRLWFHDVADCCSYVDKLVAHEQATVAAQQSANADAADELPAQQVLVVSPEIVGDNATFLSTHHFAQPISAWLQESADTLNCSVDLLCGSAPEVAATKANLLAKLSGSDTRLLFIATHGLECAPNHSQQLAQQGALLLQDWPGVSIPPTPEHYLAANMVDTQQDLSGTVAICFACYGAGTPEWADWVTPDELEESHRLATEPFISLLPQKLLAQGMLAFVGHVSRAWSTSFMNDSHTRGQHRTFRELFHQLLTGKPVGHAVDYLNTQGVRLAETLGNELDRGNNDEKFISSLWIARNDCRGYVTLGDPAVGI